VIFEDDLDRGIEGDFAGWIAQQIAHHADVAGVGEFHHYY
jgi:hypothetical protein